MGLRKGKSEARRNTHHAWGRRKKKDVRMENIRRARRNIQTWFVRTTRKNGIGFFSRGGRVSKTCPFPDLRRFMENSCPLFRPLSVNNPPMMHLSSKLSMEIPSKLLSNLVQAALSFPSSPSPFFVSIYPHACWYGMQFRCVIDHLFGSGLTCRELNGNERRGSPLLPLGIRVEELWWLNWMVPGYEFYFSFLDSTFLNRILNMHRAIFEKLKLFWRFSNSRFEGKFKKVFIQKRV